MKDTEAIAAPEPLTLEQINAAITETRERLESRIDTRRSQIKRLYADNKLDAAALAKLPRAPIVRKKAAK